MSSSAIYTVNQTGTSLTANSQIPVGGVVRRYGRNLKVSGNDVIMCCKGYYHVAVSAVLLPDAAGDVSILGYVNGSPYTGAINTGKAATAGDPVSLNLNFTVRLKECEGVPLQLRLGDEAATVSNVAMTVEKI